MEISTFNNEEFGEIRTIQENGEVLFCGADIAKALGYSNTRDALSRHCKGVVKCDTPTNGGIQSLGFISEGNVYRLIAHSKLPGAERFEKWVFDEVLPSIRKNGAYMTEDVLEQALASPDFLIELATRLKTDTRDALSRHCKGVVKCDTPTNGGIQSLGFISEGNVYRLIAHSKLPGAERFEKWVFDEVLPSIRKNGAYMTEDVLEQALASPDFLIELATRLKTEKAKNAQLTVSNQIMQPKADYFDMLVDRNLLTGIRDTAKELGVRQNDFVRFLLDKGYLYRSKKGKLRPYATYVDSGLFEMKEFVNDKTGYTDTQTMITPKGKETFRLLCI